MLSELQQLLTCRRERENRAAAALRQARLRLDQARAAVAAAEDRLDDHHQDRKQRQDKLYRQSLRSRLSKHEIDDLNIELDLMAETTDALTGQVQKAKEGVGLAMKEVEKAAAVHRDLQKAGDRWGLLVDDVAETHRRELEQAEEFAAEDDLGDRRSAGQSGLL